MKIYVAICVASLAVVSIKADTQMIDFHEVSKKVAEMLNDVTKKFEEVTGLKTEFDKDKFLYAAKSYNEKLNELQKKLKEAYDQNAKNIPNGEEIKKKLEEFSKQIQETLKNLNSPEVQKSAEKLKDVVATGLKKTSEALNELLTKFGIAPPPSIQKTFNEIVDELQKSGKSLQEKIWKIIEEAQAELKKKKN